MDSDTFTRLWQFISLNKSLFPSTKENSKYRNTNYGFILHTGNRVLGLLEQCFFIKKKKKKRFIGTSSKIMKDANLLQFI